MSTLLYEFSGQGQSISICRPFIKITGSLRDALVLGQLVFWAGNMEKSGRAWFYKRHEDLAEECGISADQVKRAVSELKKNGFVSTKRMKANGAPTTHYQVHCDKIKQDIYALRHENIGSDETAQSNRRNRLNQSAGSPNGTGGIAYSKDCAKSPKPLTDTNQINNTDHRSALKPKDPEPDKVTPQQLNSAFNEFWSVYPKRKGKANAKSAFAKLAKNRTSNEFNDLITLINNHLTHRRQFDPDWLKDGGQFIPNPSTFLNGGRWEDEYQTGDSHHAAAQQRTGQHHEFNPFGFEHQLANF